MAAKRTYNDDHAQDVNLLASLGSFGQEPQNITPAIMERFCKKSCTKLPEPFPIQLPVLVKSMETFSYEVEMKQFWVFLPHDWLRPLPDNVVEKIWGLGQLEKFWANHNTTNDPCCRKLHKVLAKTKVAPLLLHGDGGQFQREGSLMVISMRSLLSASSVGNSQMLLGAIPKICVSKSSDESLDTMKVFWKVMAWSFQSLLDGKHPVLNFDGTPFDKTDWRYAVKGTPLLGSGYSAAIFAISGDNEYYQNELKLPGYSSNQCCKDCAANKSDIPHNDYRTTAKWRVTLKTPAQNELNPPSSHPLLRIAAVVPEMIQYDTLHIIEEGCSSHAMANAIFDFVILKSKSFVGTQEQKLAALNAKIMRLQEDMQISADRRARPLTFSSFCNPSGKHTHFPELHGIKARHIRYLVPVISQICKEEFEPSKPYTYHRMKMLEQLDSLCKTIDEADFHHFSQEEANCFSAAVQHFLAHYTKCSRILYDEGSRYRYNTVTKFHNLAHMPERAKYLNPRSCSTYTGETMVGFIATLAHSCLNGTPSHLISYKLCWRWRLALDLRVNSED
jgi:hypothetical protein